MRYINAPNVAYGEDRRTYKVGVNGIEATDKIFNVSYDNGRVEAYLNGVRLFPTDDYTKASSGIGTSITLISDLGANNVLEIVGYQGINSGNALVEDNFIVGTSSTGSGGAYTNSTTVFPVASSAGDTVSVWRNGVKLIPTTDFTVADSANTVTLESAATTDDEITVQVVGGAIHNNGLTVNSGSNSFFLPTTRGTDNYVLTRDDDVGTGGTTWKETLSTPVIISVTGEINEDTNTTLTVVGSGFSAGMTLKLFNASTSADITGHTSLSYSGSTSPLTVTIPSATTNITAGTSVKLNINKSGLTADSTAITVSEDPNWVSPANNATIATILSSLGTSTNVGTALDADAGAGGGTVNYVIDSTATSATTYFDLHLTSGQITTDASNALSGILDGGDGPVTENFITYAQIAGEESTKKTARTFNIIVNRAPAGGTVRTYSGFQVHVFTSDDDFIVYIAGTFDILTLAGGGSGGGGWGGGGGAGELLWTPNVSLSAATYACDVGNGGTGAAAVGDDGDDSNFGGGSTYDVNGGGGGGYQASGSRGGRDGGSGGGAGHGNGTTYSGGIADKLSSGHGYNGSASGSSANAGGGGGGAGAAAVLRDPGGTGNSTFVGGVGTTDTSAFLKGALIGTDSSNAAVTSSSNGVLYLGGGGGGSPSYAGGVGGGGTGTGSTNGGSGLANTGSGGGGCDDHAKSGGDGGSGIVVIRYAV